MKSMTFKRLGVISFKESAGRIVEFHPRFTILKGNNSVGKTSLVRCILHALGADFKVHPRWKTAQPKVLLEVNVQGRDYQFFREWGGAVSVFHQGECLGRNLSITSGLSPILAKILDFKLHLTSNDKFVQATPAFKLLPYYIDQKNGWVSDYKGFEGLGQFQRWQDAYFQYHSGVQNNEYYKLRCKMNEKSSELDEHSIKLQELLLVKRKLDDADKSIDSSKDIKLLKKELGELLERSTEYNDKISKYKKKYFNLYNQRNDAKSALTVIKSRLREIRSDLQFATELENEFPCPTCGALYENSLSDRFSFSEDLSYCLERSGELKDEISKLDKKIESIENDSQSLNMKLEDIHQKIDSKNNDFSMREYLEEEGRRAYLKTFYSEISECSDLVDAYGKEIVNLRKELKGTQDPERRQTITDYYSERIKSVGIALNVEIPDQLASNMHCAVSDEGSLHARLILAKKLAFLETNHEYSDSVLCPFVVDTPNQQDQDDANMLKILTTIKKRTPSDLQVVLALRETYGVNFEGHTVELSKKKNLLEEEQFDETLEYVAPFLTS